MYGTRLQRLVSFQTLVLPFPLPGFIHSSVFAILPLKIQSKNRDELTSDLAILEDT